jgi:hypothetical protein
MERSCRQIGIKEDEQLSFPRKRESRSRPCESRGLFKGNGFRIKCGMTSLDKGIDSCLRRNDNEEKVFSDE